MTPSLSDPRDDLLCRLESVSDSLSAMLPLLPAGERVWADSALLFVSYAARLRARGDSDDVPPPFSLGRPA